MLVNHSYASNFFPNSLREAAQGQLFELLNRNIPALRKYHRGIGCAVESAVYENWKGINTEDIDFISAKRNVDVDEPHVIESNLNRWHDDTRACVQRVAVIRPGISNCPSPKIT